MKTLSQLDRAVLIQNTHALEIDHITPRAHGGTDAPENLRVLCRAHNDYAAVSVLGSSRQNEALPSGA